MQVIGGPPKGTVPPPPQRVRGQLSYDPEVIRDYLDECIGYWRSRCRGPGHIIFAPTYVDAFQAVREAIFGEELPEFPPRWRV